jgi:hypothetical protein
VHTTHITMRGYIYIAPHLFCNSQLNNCVRLCCAEYAISNKQ